MNINQFHELRTKYNIDEMEFICICSNLILNNKVLAYTSTVGKDKRIKSMQQAATSFFKRVDIQKFMFEQTDFLINEIKRKSKPETEQNRTKKNVLIKKEFSFPGDAQELTKENIKQVLENELSNIRDPEKRTALLIRITDLLSLQNSNSQEVDKPEIYLPDPSIPGPLK